MKKFFDAQFIPWLDGFLNFEKLPQKDMMWLEMTEALCSLLGNPEREIQCFHVAGSKGKGSVAKMISCILSEYVSEKYPGLKAKTALYTSPHILDVRERICDSDGFFDEEIYEKSARFLMEKVNGAPKGFFPARRKMTWFELVTAFAFLCAKNAGVKYSVYEVGLGGRLDATNVIKPLVSVINQIELEHTEYLGDTIEKIAAEKAGIIKENVPCICGWNEKSVIDVFKQAASQKSAPLYLASDIIFGLEYKMPVYPELKMTVSFNSPLFSRPIKASLSMPGEVQAKNAALASCAVKLGIPDITENQIERGLEKAALPARFQITGGNDEAPVLVIDGAHTVKSVKGTLETFSHVFKNELDKTKPHLLFACAADKDVDDMARLFEGKFSRITLTRPGATKCCDPERMKEAFCRIGGTCKGDENAGKTEILYEDVYKSAIVSALNGAKKEKAVLLCCGSFYLASEVIQICMKNNTI